MTNAKPHSLEPHGEEIKNPTYYYVGLKHKTYENN